MAWIAAAAAIAGALISSSSSSDAADAQTAAADKSSATQLQMYKQQREDLAPYRAVGVPALNQLASQLGINTNPAGGYDPAEWSSTWHKFADPYGRYIDADSSEGRQIQQQVISDLNARGIKPASNASTDPNFGALNKKFSQSDFEADPGYNFRLQEGLKAVNASAAAKGLLQSGANLKGINRFAQDSASQEYGNAFNRFQLDQGNQFNRLAALSGIGQTATQQLNTAGQGLANNLSANQIAAGNATSAGIIGQGNALTNGISQGVNFYQQNQLLNTLRNRGAVELEQSALSGIRCHISLAP